MQTARTLLEQIQATTFVDTHEHLLDESTRLSGGHTALGCNDWTVLLSHYVCDDLHSGGWPKRLGNALFERPGKPSEKIRLVEPFWRSIRHTGYGQALRLTLRQLYDLDDLSTATVEELAERYNDLLRPGFYRRVLREHCRIDHCHVNSVEDPIFKVSEDPSLLAQDINITPLVSPIANPPINQRFEDRITDLDSYLACIREVFDLHGPAAVAVKSINAYQRRLDFAPVDQARAERVFRRAWKEGWAAPEDIKSLEDFLLRFCVGEARRHDLPVKFHTGHHVGTGEMRLSNVAHNASDLAELVADFPDVRFVAFHIGYPYQHEFVSLAKHFPNLTVDMCWSWILDPQASVTFLKSFLGAVPHNKLFTFGGDFIPVELVVGHAAIARRGIAQALAELVEEGWIGHEDVPALIAALMHGNAATYYGAAHETFD